MECERERDASIPHDGKTKSIRRPLYTGPAVAKSGLAKGLVQQRGLAVVGVLAQPTLKDVDGVVTAVDAAFSNASQYSVVVDDAVALDAMLNQTNFEAGANINKYYKCQALKDLVNDSYALWTRWGRIGELVRTNTQLKSCPTKEAVIALFHRTFKSKTGCAWANRDTATPREKKYAYVAQRVEAPKVATPATEVPSALAPPVYALMKKVLGSDRTVKAQLDELGVDVSGGVIRLTDGQLSAAHGVLERISTVLNKGVEVAVDSDAADDVVDAVDVASTMAATLRSLSDEFYALVPTRATTASGSGTRGKLPTIDTQEKLSAALERLEALASGSAAAKLMEAVRGKDDGRNPIDAAIDAMGLGIELVPPESALFQQLASHIVTSDLHGLDLRLDEVFAVNVAGDAKKSGPEPSLLLYHGTRLVNMTKILRDGLLAKGHGSVQIGAMFGKGVYLANASSKSLTLERSSTVTHVHKSRKSRIP